MFRSFLAPLNRRILFFIISMAAIAVVTVVLICGSTIMLSRQTRHVKIVEHTSQSLAIALKGTLTEKKIKMALTKISESNPWPFLDFVAITNLDHQIIASSGTMENIQWLQLKQQGKFIDGSRILVSTPIRKKTQITGYVVMGSDIHFFDRGIKKYLLLSAISGCIGLLLSLFVAHKLHKRMLQPLYALTTAAEEIGASQNYSLRVPCMADDELGQLITQFNSMLEQIERRNRLLTSHQRMLEQAVKLRTSELATKNTQLEQEIAERKEAEMIRCEVERINQHDLKSLLNLVIGYPELLLKQGDLNPKQENFIKKIELAGYRMLDMINNNLDIFKMEKGIYKLRSTSVELVHLLHEIQDDTVSMLTRSGVTLRLVYDSYPMTRDHVCFATGEYRLLQTLFSNLIINAIEASNEDDIVTVEISPKSPVVTIHNNSVVPESIHDRFFNKYVTYGKEDGTGLGTYSAKLIANAHNAQIEMMSTKECGTIVTIQFSPQTDTAENNRSMYRTRPRTSIPLQA